MTTQFDKAPVTPARLQSELLTRSASSPYVLYPAVAAALGAIAGALFGFSTLLFILLIAGATVATAGFATEFGLRREANIKLILREATERMERQRDEIIALLQREIHDESLPTAREQLTEFKKKFDAFVDVLDDRFTPGELTFVRYMSVAEQVYLSALDNLRNAVTSSKAVQSTNVKELDRRLAKLGDTPNDNIERAALTERLQGFEATTKTITDLIVMNEKALATLEGVTQTLARTQVSKGMAESDIESAVAELGRMGQMLARFHRN